MLFALQIAAIKLKAEQHKADLDVLLKEISDKAQSYYDRTMEESYVIDDMRNKLQGFRASSSNYDLITNFNAKMDEARKVLAKYNNWSPCNLPTLQRAVIKRGK